MPILTYDLSYISPALAWDRVRAWVEPSTPDGWIADGQVWLGDTPAPVASNGTGSIELTETPEGGGYQMRVDYWLPGENARRTWRSGWFELTADADLADLVTIDVPGTPTTALSEFKSEVEADYATKVELAEAVMGEPIAITDGVIAGRIEDPASATSTALKAGIAEQAAPRAGSRGDGSNVLRLRRPTLVVDRVFPSPSHDHEIVHVDDTERVAYAIGRDRRLRKGRWTEYPAATTRAGMDFGPALAAPPTGKSWAPNGTFFRIKPKDGLPNGALLIEERNTGAGSLTGACVIKRCVNDDNSGAPLVFDTVWTAPANTGLLGPQSLARDEVTGHLYVVEYATNPAVTEVNIWRSTDDGATWAKWFTYPRTDGGTGTGPGSIRHWHSARWDEFSERVYFMAGDQNDDAGLWRVSADGSTAEKVITNAQLRAQTGQVAPARAVDCMFFPNYIAWPCDGSGGVNYITSLARDQIGSSSPVVEQVAGMSSLGWWTQKASDDGSAWVACSSNEIVPYQLDNSVHLYSVIETESGLQVDEVASTLQETSSSSSISGLGGGNGGGDRFWLRSHSHVTGPRLTYSGFQFRGELAWGAVPLAPPLLERRHYGQGNVNGVFDLANGQTIVIGHTVAPEQASGFDILDVGILALESVGGGFALLQVYDVNSSTARFTFSTQTAGLASWRANGQDTTVNYPPATPSNVTAATRLFAAGTVIHFRLLGFGGSGATCKVSAHLRYGWSFA